MGGSAQPSNSEKAVDDEESARILNEVAARHGSDYLAAGGHQKDYKQHDADKPSMWRHLPFVVKSPLGILFLVIFFEVSGTSMIMPVFQFFCAHDLHLSAIWTGLLFSAYNGVRILAAPVNGRLSDAFGRRVVLLACFFSGSVALVLMSLASSFTQLLWVMVFFGLASSGNLPVSVAAVGDCADPTDRASLIGLLFAVGNSGMVIAPVLLVMAMYLKLITRRSAFLIGGIVCFVGFAIGFCVLRETLPLSKRRPLRFSMNVCGGGTGACSQVGSGLICIWFGGFFVSLTFMTLLTTYALLVNLAFGYTDVAFGIIMAFSGLLGAACQVLLLPFGNKLLGRHWLAILGNFVMAASVGALPLSTQSIYVHLLCLGTLIVSMAFVDAAMPDLVTAYAPSENHLGFANGVANAFKALGCVLAPLAAGILWEFNFSLPFYVAAACSTVAGILVAFAWFCGSSAPEAQQERLMGNTPVSTTPPAVASRRTTPAVTPPRTPPVLTRQPSMEEEGVPPHFHGASKRTSLSVTPSAASLDTPFSATPKNSPPGHLTPPAANRARPPAAAPLRSERSEW